MTWGSVDLDDSVRRVYVYRSVLSNGSLSFTAVEHSLSHRPDEGVYQCVATIRDVGTIVSSKATVTLSGE